MIGLDNLPLKLCEILKEENPEEEAIEWRILGQEQDGTLLFAWNNNFFTSIGSYDYQAKQLKKLFQFDDIKSVVQASVNSLHTLLGFVTKIVQDDKNIYEAYLVTLDVCEHTSNDKFNTDGSSKNNSSSNKFSSSTVNFNGEIFDLGLKRSKQIMVKFLYKKHYSVLSDKQHFEKLLVLIHEECVLQYQIKCKENMPLVADTLVRTFVWAQWDVVHQTLYYIHFRKPIKSLVEGEDLVVNDRAMPTLSGLQFHDDLPHETVLNIPLNLPHNSPSLSNCGIYEDDTIPLRIHDCSLDLMVITNSAGAIYICHHYLYQPVQPAVQLEEDDETEVHFAYSVTVLHHSCVVHCVVPGIPWKKAKTIRPLFNIYDDHILVLIPTVCIQLLDVGLNHEPSSHVTLRDQFDGIETYRMCFTPIINCGNHAILNLTTLDVLDLTISVRQLKEAFQAIEAVENKLSIIHYLLVHVKDLDSVVDLLSIQIEAPIVSSLPRIFKEFLIGSSYSSAQRNLPQDAQNLINLLPLSTQTSGCEIEVSLDGKSLTLTQDALWNASMMILSPQQRVVPYRADIWVKLWENMLKNTKRKPRFRSSQVVEKLMVSLVCYQPEALSRSSTPMSPANGLTISSVSVSKDLNTYKTQFDTLPFYEVESCTASKQEHIISVNLRELSMHLLKQTSTDNKMTRFNWQSQTPMHVHAVATRYIASQLEQSKYLCQILCKFVTLNTKYETDKGFVFVDRLPEDKRKILFVILERYYLAVESIAFPLPQGFTSFFTFLGYRTLKFDRFLQYVQRNVFELQVDVMKIIMADLEDTKTGIKQKLSLLTLLPRSRARRLLSQWHHPISLMLKAREHSLNILSGVEGSNCRIHSGTKKSANYQNHLGLTAFPTDDRLSPLDTFLDLLTAKASLNELDFGLLIEATVTSIEGNLHGK